MSDIYGFDNEPKPISLPRKAKVKIKKSNRKDRAAIEAAALQGETQGFVNRSGGVAKKIPLTPGRKRTEDQDRITIPGPKRVIDRLRLAAKQNNVAVWKALEMALDGELIDT